jgi:hypothetical protein
MEAMKTQQKKVLKKKKNSDVKSIFYRLDSTPETIEVNLKRL